MDGLLSVHSFFAVMETTGSTGEDISPKSSSFKQREKRVANSEPTKEIYAKSTALSDGTKFVLSIRFWERRLPDPSSILLAQN
jgi:hypothetical protein